MWRLDYIAHHGIKGQKWGVRRFQNSDGSLTEEGVYRYRVKKAARTKSEVDEIYNSLSKEDKRLLGDDVPSKEYLTLQEGEYVVKRFLSRDGNTPAAFLDIMTTTKQGHLTVALATKPEYRAQGRALKLAQQGKKWFEKNADKYNYVHLSWGAYAENTGSRKIAEKAGFKYEPENSTADWAEYGIRR